MASIHAIGKGAEALGLAAAQSVACCPHRIGCADTNGKQEKCDLFKHFLLSIDWKEAAARNAMLISLQNIHPTKSNIERTYFRVNVSLRYIFVLLNIPAKPVQCGIWRDWRAPNVYTILAPQAGKRPVAGATGRAAAPPSGQRFSVPLSRHSGLHRPHMLTQQAA